MAESEEQGQQEESGKQPDDTSQAAARGKQKFIIIGILILVVLIISGVLYLFFFSEDEADIAAAGGVHSKYIAEYLARQQVSIDQIRQTGIPIFTREFAFTANMARGKNIIKLVFKATLYDGMAREHLARRRPYIEDTILALLKKTEPNDLRSRAGLELLKLEIYRILNSVFDQSFIELSESKDRSPVKDILITQYYIN